MSQRTRPLVGVLVFTLAACGTRAPEPTGGAGPDTDNGVGPSTADNCFEPWRTAGNMAQERYIASAVRLGDGTVVVAGGYGNSGVISSAERFDPTTGAWSPAGTLNVPRYYHRAIALKDGRALVVGGFDESGPTTTVEIYNPAANTWSLVAPMSIDRYAPQVTLLDDGRVLVAGGIGGGLPALDSAEIYDPQANAWQPAGTMTTPRYLAAVAVLGDGKVLVAGGHNGTDYQSSVEVFDPATMTWSSGPSMSVTRYASSAAMLPNGKVLVVGGTETFPGAEIFDPAAGTWSPTGSMAQSSRYFSETNRLPDGRVLIAGGSGSSGIMASAELFDPATGLWSQVAAMSTPRYLSASTALNDGRILVAGGFDDVGNILSAAETYKPCPQPVCANAWQSTANMAHERYIAAGVPLADGTVLAAGGLGANGSVTGTAERYNPTAETWSAAGTMRVPRSGHRAVRLQDGRVLVAGGSTDRGPTAAVEIYNPSTNAWSSVASMSTARNLPQLIVLSDGRVLASGGQGTSTPVLATAEIYTPSSNSWSAAGTMRHARYLAGVALLSSGRVVVAGGHDGTSPQSSTEIFNPSTRTWASGPSMSVARYAFGTSVLQDGRVLVAGGTDLPPGAEILDSNATAWSLTSNMVQLSRFFFETILLADGRVLVAGGTGSNWVELYDPNVHTWLALAGMSAPRFLALSSELPDGRVLVAGGFGGSGVTNSAEVYKPCPPNQPPVARCRNRFVPTSATTCSAASVNVDNGSFDPDHLPGPLTLSESPAGPYGLGTSIVTLTASDGALQDTCRARVTVVDRTPPVITCPANQTLECQDGGATGDFHATVTDNCGGAQAFCPNHRWWERRIPPGTHTEQCFGVDRSWNWAGCTFQVTVADTKPPVPGTSRGKRLEAEDGRYRRVSLSDCAHDATDACDGRIDLDHHGTITHVTSDELEDAPGDNDGRTRNDILLVGNRTIWVRAENDRTLDGRVYTVHYRVSDHAGHSVSSTCTVSVPRRRDRTAVDSGPRYCVGSGC
jgi:N-acetylneuraminic acid mutarotase